MTHQERLAADLRDLGAETQPADAGLVVRDTDENRSLVRSACILFEARRDDHGRSWLIVPAGPAAPLADLPFTLAPKIAPTPSAARRQRPLPLFGKDNAS